MIRFKNRQEALDRNAPPGDKSACWPWRGGLTSRGYGKASYRGKTFLAHRLAWEHYFGAVPEGLIVTHTCEDSTCVNPRHLKLTTTGEVRQPRTAEEIFEKYAVKLEGSRKGCWMWIGGVSEDGYGKVRFNGKIVRAHRLSYEHFIGPVPEGLLVCHSCDAPLCVNPAHLWAGTAKANTLDMLYKGRHKTGLRERLDDQKARTHCPQGHLYEGDNLRIGADGKRYCRECARATQARLRADKEATNAANRAWYHSEAGKALRDRKKREKALEPKNPHARRFRSSNHMVGDLCVVEVAEKLGMNEASVRDRIALGWSVDDILNTPPKKLQQISYYGEAMSIRELARRTGLSKTAIANRIAQGYSAETAVDRIRAT